VRQQKGEHSRRDVEACEVRLNGGRVRCEITKQKGENMSKTKNELKEVERNAKHEVLCDLKERITGVYPEYWDDIIDGWIDDYKPLSK